MLGQRIQIQSVGGVEIPMDLYIPETTEEIDEEIQRPSVVVFPGGGYRFLSHREAEPVALQLVAAGFNAFVAWNRVAPNHHPIPVKDAASAVAAVRAHASEWHCDPKRIAIMGFSAGGHLTASLGTNWHRAEMWQEMGLSPDDVRPNAMVLCYPVITGGEFAHRDSFINLTGTLDKQKHEALSADAWVTESCPPTFLWHTFEDELVPMQNSLLMAQALAKHGVLTEMHIFPYGRHGLSLCTEQTSGAQHPDLVVPDAARWMELALTFLKRTM